MSCRRKFEGKIGSSNALFSFCAAASAGRNNFRLGWSTQSARLGVDSVRFSSGSVAVANLCLADRAMSLSPSRAESLIYRICILFARFGHRRWMVDLPGYNLFA